MEVILANDAGINISTKFPLEVAQKPFPPILLVDRCQVSQCDKSKSIKTCQLFSDNFLGKIVASFGKIDHDGFLLLDNVGLGADHSLYIAYLYYIVVGIGKMYCDHMKATILLT